MSLMQDRKDQIFEYTSPWVRIFDIIKKVKYKDWTFFVHPVGESYYLQIRFYALDPCVEEAPIPTLQQSRKWLLSQHMTDSEVIQTCFLAVMTAEEHEIRENFKYDSVAVLGPHFDLVAMASQQKQYDFRK